MLFDSAATARVPEAADCGPATRHKHGSAAADTPLLAPVASA
jgi:hypothetical protein